MTDELAELRETERQRWGAVLDHFDACQDCPTAGSRGCQEAQSLRAKWKGPAYALAASRPGSGERGPQICSVRDAAAAM